MWSTTWPLTPAVLLLLAIIRLRTDALKMLVHYRRPVPSRDAAGIWTGALVREMFWLPTDPLRRMSNAVCCSHPWLGLAP